MSGHTKWSKLRDELMEKPGAVEAVGNVVRVARRGKSEVSEDEA